MKQLIYISRATKPFDNNELAELAAISSAANKQRNVTGCLTYNEGVFLQLLEGEDSVVDSLYAHIAADPRHTKSRIVYSRQESK
ncbi:BLUF domain-containing protein [Alteromonas sp. ASW11-36]|uniref:BLUF domain-containing protein n=1 Tax=Alteromonas arenosi TaxID=3055817 RepID=A0ABT7SY51_9ALTE|nr:BLUF domain-containing protein [Alteromonas sp. ASW11-36]MDM7861090.1 BLUF domain-containing protein [Alteromonas sp. ASW11-36]